MNTSQVELLAPAGNWECAKAAIENGADAIYFGLDSGFNARARATNFHIAELPDLIDTLHRQLVKGYVTLNTLVFTDELPALEEHVRQIAAAGVDAVLVQDLGVARLVRELCPELEIHASTQMTLTNADSIEMSRELGVQRVVLARELSIKEIREISSATTMPLEVFVHGALCVAYSGQCLTSESLGGRSANRGQCAQACRLPYELYCDGEHRDLGDVQYLLSPLDLAAHDLVPELIAAGVCSLKIEGRLKTPEYVANVCSQYRAAIDAALEGEPRKLTVEQQRELEMSFSRGFSPGWLEGCDHKRLAPGKTSAKRGVYLGKVISHQQDNLNAMLEAPLAIGDGIVLEGDRFAGKELGGRVYGLRVNSERVDQVESGQVTIGMQYGSLPTKAHLEGLSLWKTDDPQLNKRLRRSFTSADPNKKVPLTIHVRVAVGQPIKVRLETPDCPSFWMEFEHLPETARKHPLTNDTLHTQLSRLGATVYELHEFSAQITDEPMVPLSVLGQLRKQVIADLDARRSTRPLTCASANVAERLLQESQDDSAPEHQQPVLRALCRSLQQLEMVLASGCRDVIAEFQDIREYRQAVEIARSANARIELATLRIHKPTENGLFKALAKHSADGWLVRNLAAMRFCREQEIPFACDFSLNATNPLTVRQLVDWGATRITSSYDLNRDQLLELVNEAPSQRLEVVVHQHMPMFHMEHCVFCSVLSPGKNKSDCGRPCDRHLVQLKDRVGASHVLHADIGCRNTLYNGTAQSGAEAVAPLLDAGVYQFRVELLHDADQQEVAKLIELYTKLIDGELEGPQVWNELKATNRVGVTRGTLEHPRNPLAIL